MSEIISIKHERQEKQALLGAIEEIRAHITDEVQALEFTPEE